MKVLATQKKNTDTAPLSSGDINHESTIDEMPATAFFFG
jgi:hypothetical protein